MINSSLFLFGLPPPPHTLPPSPQYPRCYHPPSPISPLLFLVEFSVSPFQTFFNSGIKGDGGIGEIRLRDPPGIVWESADKKKKALLWFWFGRVGVGWGQGGGGRGGVGRFGGQVALLLGRLLFGLWEEKESAIFGRRGRSSCFLFIVSGEISVSCLDLVQQRVPI